MPDLQSIPVVWIAVAAGGVVVFVLIVVVIAALLRRGKRGAGEPRQEVDLSIDVAALPFAGPPANGPRLEFYGLPVRLTVLVIAPAGRGAVIPSKDRLRDTVERLVPGLGGVLDTHQPIFRRWPQQLSVDGFAHTFFTKVMLPGDSGKGTPYSSISGRFDAGGGPLLAGLVLCAEHPNAYGVFPLKHHGQWHELLRVRAE